ncbi:MAG: hypothetical protein IJ087_21355 [Eggerthellaceae bacterium]|nr:hypothetical protein [Eggerthellaceae bacterium]
MKTVLFIDGLSLCESFDRTRRIFKEFERSGDVVVHPWRRGSGGFSADEVNDVLGASIGEDEQWRAIVVADLSSESLSGYACELWSAETEEEAALAREKIEAIAPYLGAEGTHALNAVGLDAATAEFDRSGSQPEPQPRFVANPFDFVQNLDLAGYPSAIQHPVVKLAQQLAGLPAHIRDEECVGLSLSQIDTILQDEAERGRLVAQVIGDDRMRDGESAQPGEASSDEAERLDGVEQPDGQSPYEDDAPNEAAFSEAILAMARTAYPETTCEGYRSSDLVLKCPRPNDLILVSYRDVPDNVPAASVAERGGCTGSVRSEFTIRNHYPDQARFIVVDRQVNGTDRRIRGEMAFWSSILVLALNTGTSFDMRSYTLYKLDVGVDYDQFADAMRSKHAYAASARQLLEERLQKVERSFTPDEDDNTPLPPYAAYVSVNFKVPDEVALEIPVKKYGWLKDTFKARKSAVSNLVYGLGSMPKRLKRMPPLDEARYGADRGRFDRAMEDTLEEPRYALQAAARDFHEIESLSQDMLTGYKTNTRQTDALEKGLREKELKLAGTYNLSLFDSDVFDKLMGLVDKRVKNRMQTRAYLREVALVALITVMAALVAFFPYLFGSMGGLGANAASIGVSLASIAVLLGVGAFTLKMSHWQVRRMLRGVNEYLHVLVDQLRSKADELGNRISEYATYRKGYALLVRQYDEQPAYTAESIALRMDNAKVKKILAEYESDFEALGIVPEQSPEHSFLTWVQAKAAVEEQGFFDFEPEPFFPERPFNDELRTGKKVRVPYGFIESLDVREVPIYEPGYERGCAR